MLDAKKQAKKSVGLSKYMYGPNDYPVYPEDDGYDRPRNPYSPV